MSTRENLCDVVTETDGNWVDKLTGGEPFLKWTLFQLYHSNLNFQYSLLQIQLIL